MQLTENDCLAVSVRLPAAPLTARPSAVVIEGKERSCDSLLMCIVTVLSHGLRSGGGVGDVLRKPSKEVQKTTDEDVTPELSLDYNFTTVSLNCIKFPRL